MRSPSFAWTTALLLTLAAVGAAGTPLAASRVSDLDQTDSSSAAVDKSPALHGSAFAYNPSNISLPFFDLDFRERPAAHREGQGGGGSGGGGEVVAVAMVTATAVAELISAVADGTHGAGGTSGAQNGCGGDGPSGARTDRADTAIWLR